MASANSILVNANTVNKNTDVINEFLKNHLFENALIRNHNKLVNNSDVVDIDESYDFRPDRLAYDIYGEDFFYPAILAANNLGSMLQFKASVLDYKCLIPNKGVIMDMLEIQSQTRRTSDIIEELFSGIENTKFN